MQSLCNNKEIKFQYIPGWIELNLQDISGAVYDKCTVDQYGQSTYQLLITFVVYSFSAFARPRKVLQFPSSTRQVPHP